MAAKPIPMSKVKQFIHQHQQGLGIKTIARNLHISRNTVKTYIRRLNALLADKPNATGLIAELLAMDNPVLETLFVSGPAPAKQDRLGQLMAFFEQTKQAMNKPGFTRLHWWEKYQGQVDDGYGRSQFFHHFEQFLKASDPSMVLTHQAGKELMVDFAGKKLHYVDRKTGELIDVSVLVCTLPYSDYGFAIGLASQSTQDFLHGLKRCLQHLGGAPKILIPDNLKAAVIQADRYEPKLNEALSDFCSHYHIAVVPARVRKPKDKALVENQVKLVYQRVFAPLHGQTFFDLDTLNAHIAQLMAQHNARPMQRRSGSRLSEFTAAEKPLLTPLPSQDFELKYYSEHTTGKNNHIYISRDKHSYSVPFRLIGQRVKAISTRTMVYIYHQGDQVAAHRRGIRQGGYTSEPKHLCSTHQAYLDRNPEQYISRAGKLSATLAQMFTLIFQQNSPPETFYKTCEGILSMARKASPEQLELVCKDVINAQVFRYGFIKNVFAKHSQSAHGHELEDRPLPEHENTRGASYYSQTPV